MSLDKLLIKDNNEEVMKKVIEIALPYTSNVSNHFLYGKGDNIELDGKDLYESCYDVLSNVYTNFQELCNKFDKAGIKFFMFDDTMTDNPITKYYMGCNEGVMEYCLDEGFINVINATGIFAKYKLPENEKEILRKAYDKISNGLVKYFDFYDIENYPNLSKNSSYLTENAKEEVTFSEDENKSFAHYIELMNDWNKNYCSVFRDDTSLNNINKYDLIAYYL